MSANTVTANTWTIEKARDALRKGEISAVDLTMSCLTAIDAGDGLGAFVHKTPEIALDQARAADVRLKAGDAPSLCGIPLGIKDLFCTKGVPSQAGSNILKGFRPEYESTVTTKLFDAGEPNHELLKIIRANVRTPDETVGDLYAQASCNAVGARSLLQMMDEFGLNSIDPLANAIIARSEAAMREAILGEGPPPVPADQALTVMRILDAGLRSAAERREIVF